MLALPGPSRRKPAVPYLKCVPCKIRVSTAGTGTPLTDGSCPGCGLALEPVVKLTELLGFRSPNLLDPSLDPRVAEPVTDISGGRAVAEAQLESDRWLAAAIALDIPPSI
jgi:hypothetical protein